jgi:hypothetical protein
MDTLKTMMKVYEEYCENEKNTYDEMKTKMNDAFICSLNSKPPVSPNEKDPNLMTYYQYKEMLEKRNKELFKNCRFYKK